MLDSVKHYLLKSMLLASFASDLIIYYRLKDVSSHILLHCQRLNFHGIEEKVYKGSGNQNGSW